MNLLKKVWHWISIVKNHKTLAFIGSGLIIVVTAGWQGYLHFATQPEEPKLSVTASGNGIASSGDIKATAANGGNAVIATGNVTIGITLEQYEAGLKRREQEVRHELTQAGAADKDKLALLNKQLADLQAKLQHPETALADYKQKLAEAYKAIDDIKQEVLPEQIKQAQTALSQGETSEAETLFKQVLNRGKDNAAEAAFQLAQLAKNRIEYVTAYQHYQEAVSLQPDNALYLNDAGYMAYTLGKYAEAETLYQRSLAIREKASGRDHPGVAESLNNLAVLYVAQGKYAEAEPLHQRSLAIDEKALGHDHPLVATILNNLAELYRSQGKYAEAEPLYQRSLAIDEKALGKDHPTTKIIKENLSQLQARLKGGAFQVRVKAVLPNGQAEQLGLAANDILLRYNHNPILGMNAFIYGRSLEPPTQTAMELTVLRKGKELVFKVKPGKIGGELEEIAVKQSLDRSVQ